LNIPLEIFRAVAVFAGELANTPAVWTAERGLSEAFIQKYERFFTKEHKMGDFTGAGVGIKNSGKDFEFVFGAKRRLYF
jgi:hypothetical protein